MTDEEFFAWLDGELEGAEADRVAAAVAADPALQARADAHRAMTDGLRSAFQPVADSASAPPSFGAGSESKSPRKAANENDRWHFGFPQWGAMAASLVLGLLIAPAVLNRPSGPVATDGAKLTASGDLDRALDTQLASAEDGQQIRIGLTFRDKSGEVCRTFSGKLGTGLACRDGEEWRLLSIFGPASGASTDYRMAAGDDPRMSEYVDRLIAGEPLDAAGEKAAMDAGWR